MTEQNQLTPQNPETTGLTSNQPNYDAVQENQNSIPTESSYQQFSIPNRSVNIGGKPFQPKKRSKWPLVLFLCMFVVGVVFGGLFAMGVFGGRSNAEKLFSAINQNIQLTESDSSYAFKVDNLVLNDSNNFLTNLFGEKISPIGMVLHSKQNLEKKKLEIDYGFSVRDIDLFNINIQQENLEFLLKSLNLSNKTIFLSKDGMYEVIDTLDASGSNRVEEVFQSISFEKIENYNKNVRPVLNPMNLSTFKKLNKKGYLKRVLDYYNERLTVEKGSRSYSGSKETTIFEGDVYVLKENLGETFGLYLDVYSDLLADPNFRPFVEQYLDRIITTAEKHKDVVLYNYLSQFADYAPFKSEWDEDVKAHLVYVKQLILSTIEEEEKRFEKPSEKDKVTKAINFLKGLNLNAESVFVVNKLVKYYEFNAAVNVEEINKKVNSLDVTIPADDNIVESFDMTFIAVLHAVGKDVTFEPFDKEHAFDYGAASKEEKANLAEEIVRNALIILQSLEAN